MRFLLSLLAVALSFAVGVFVEHDFRVVDKASGNVAVKAHYPDASKNMSKVCICDNKCDCCPSCLSGSKCECKPQCDCCPDCSGHKK
jgi:hypothetical protein